MTNQVVGGQYCGGRHSFPAPLVCAAGLYKVPLTDGSPSLVAEIFFSDKGVFLARLQLKKIVANTMYTVSLYLYSRKSVESNLDERITTSLEKVKPLLDQAALNCICVPGGFITLSHSGSQSTAQRVALSLAHLFHRMS